MTKTISNFGRLNLFWISIFGFVVLPFLFLVSCGGEAASPVKEVAAGETDAGSVAQKPEIKSVAILDTTGNVAVDAGFAAHGTIIGIPVGFTAAQCKFTAAPSSIDGGALSIHVSMDDTSGEVTCQKVVQERDEIPPVAKDCVASYTILCVK